MLKDVTFGRYYKTDSSVHNLDPRTKMLWLILFIVSVIISDSIELILTLSLILVIYIVISHVPLKYMVRGLGTVFFILLITDFLNILLIENGFEKSIMVTTKTIQIILASNLVSVTTRPKDIADGIETAFGKINVHDFATMVLIAFRFIPLLTSEAENIIDAQKARGVNFEEGSIFKRVKTLSAVIIPVFVCAVRRADTLAEAMDSRLYGTGKHTRLYPLHFSKSDYLVIALSITVFAAVIVGRVIC